MNSGICICVFVFVYLYMVCLWICICVFVFFSFTTFPFLSPDNPSARHSINSDIKRLSRLLSLWSIYGKDWSGICICIFIWIYIYICIWIHICICAGFWAYGLHICGMVRNCVLLEAPLGSSSTQTLQEDVLQAIYINIHMYILYTCGQCTCIYTCIFVHMHIIIHSATKR